MKKMVLRNVAINAHTLSKEEKKQIVGGYTPEDCTPRGCKCVYGMIRCDWYNPNCMYPDVVIKCYDYIDILILP